MAPKIKRTVLYSDSSLTHSQIIMIISSYQCRQYVEQEVTIQGWLVHKHSSGQVRFFILRNETGNLQAIMFKNKVSPKVFLAFDQLTQESSLSLTGILHDHSRAPGGVELGIRSLNIFPVTQEYPISPKEHGIAFLRSP